MNRKASKLTKQHIIDAIATSPEEELKRLSINTSLEKLELKKESKRYSKSDRKMVKKDSFVLNAWESPRENNQKRNLFTQLSLNNRNQPNGSTGGRFQGRERLQSSIDTTLYKSVTLSNAPQIEANFTKRSYRSISLQKTP